MKLIELHILQSSPVSCLNRDDVGSPKTATFGGVQRARLSSQCLKRAVRLAAAEESPAFFQGERTRLIITPLLERVAKHGIDPGFALEASKLLCDSLSTFDAKAEEKGVLKVKTMTMFSPLELDAIAAAMAEILKEPSFGPIASDAKKREAQAKKLKPAIEAAKSSTSSHAMPRLTSASSPSLHTPTAKATLSKASAPKENQETVTPTFPASTSSRKVGSMPLPTRVGMARNCERKKFGQRPNCGIWADVVPAHTVMSGILRRIWIKSLGLNTGPLCCV